MSKLIHGPAYPLVLRQERVILNHNLGEFLPHDAGEETNIVEVLDRQGVAYDAIAWRDTDPNVWASRTRCATFLGEAEIERAAVLEVPLFLFRTPARWVLNHQPGGRWPAACVVGWDEPDQIALALNKVRIVTSPPIAEKLEDVKRKLTPEFRVRVIHPADKPVKEAA